MERKVGSASGVESTEVAGILNESHRAVLSLVDSSLLLYKMTSKQILFQQSCV